jgi:quercetin dioxygenase-like cupin family protein
MPDGSGFSTWNGVESWEFVDGVRLHAIGGDQVLLCRVQYEPGKQVPRHAHEHTEQLMAVVEGSVTMTIGDETRELTVGDVVCVN